MKNLFLLVLFSVFTVFSQEYKLDSIMYIAMQNSIVLINAKLDNNNTKSNARIGYLDILPSINASYSKENLFSTNLSSTVDQAGIGVNKTISLANNVFFDISKDRLLEKSSQLNYLSEKKQLAYQILSQYLNIVEVQENIAVQKEQIEVQNKIYEHTKMLFDQKQISSFELNKSEIDLIDVKLQMENLKNQESNLRSALFTQLRIKDKGYPLSDPQLKMLNMDSLDKVISAIDSNYNTLDIQVLEYNLKTANISLLQQRLNFLPDISAGYSYTNSLMGNGNTNFSFDASKGSNSVYLNASYGLDHLFINSEKSGQIRNSIIKQQLGLQNKRETLTSDLNNTIQNLKHLNEILLLSAKQNTQAEENYKIAQEKYAMGMIALVDIETARTQYNNAVSSNISAKFNVLKTQEGLNLLLSEKILGKW